MQDITAPYEYTISEKKTPRLRLRRAGLITLYILFPIVILVIVATSKVGALFAPMCAFLAIATWMLVFFTWRYVSIEYEYTVVSGRVTFCKIYGGRSRKKITEFMIKEAEAIAPDNKANADKIKYFSPDKEYNCISAPGAEDAYFMTFRNEEGTKCVVRFEATSKMLGICRFYNPSVTVMGKVRF